MPNTYDPVYYAAHREEILQRNRAYQAAHRKELNEKGRTYHHANTARQNAKSRAYRAAHHEELKAKQRAAHAAKREERNATVRAKRAADPERYRQVARKSYQKHRIENAAKSRAYAQAHREEVLAKKRDYAKAHPAQRRETELRRRARQYGAARATLSPAQWQEIKDAFDHRCAYCGRKMQRLTRDHITPVVDHGDYHIHNIVPACGSCNRRKHIGPPPVPVQPLLLTIAPEHKKR